MPIWILASYPWISRIKSYFYKVNEIANQNLEVENRPCIDNGFLIIGCGLNGDPIVVNIRTNEVGYVFRDRLWESGTPHLNDITINLGLNIAEFFSNCLKHKNFPVDAYQAEEYEEKREP